MNKKNISHVVTYDKYLYKEFFFNKVSPIKILGITFKKGKEVYQSSNGYDSSLPSFKTIEEAFNYYCHPFTERYQLIGNKIYKKYTICIYFNDKVHYNQYFNTEYELQDYLTSLNLDSKNIIILNDNN